ncbi:MAG: repeat containing protein [Candidatus Kaiserbacteria bacterium]|nr:repeat containing protein [Candidatus Kaiserbacteria bacterium]
MFKRIAVTGLGLALLATPFVASADLLSDLQAKLVALQSQLTSVNASAGTNTSAACPSLNAVLSVGARGSDVTTLQTFLVAQGFLSSDSATGYFGLLTQGAVQRFQAQAGIVSSGNPFTTGYGSVGRLTREAIRNMCKAISTNPPAAPNVTFSASPASGAAPLNVTFTESGLPAGTYQVNFGDSANGTITVPSIMCITTPCNPGPQSTSHTYSLAGTYTVTLSGTPCASGAMCAQVIRTLGTATITVSGAVSQADTTFTASPTSGTAPLTVSFSASGPSGTNFSSISYGDGTSGSLNAAPVCASCNAASSASHVYATAGTYTVTLGYMPPCAVGMACAQVVQTKTVTITVNAPASQADTVFSASPTSGTAPLSVAFSATGPSGTNFSSITFGDGTSGSLNAAPVCASCNASSAASHTYTTTGTYTATLGYMPPCPSGMACTQVMQTKTVTITVSGSQNPTIVMPTCSETFSSSTTGTGIYFTDSWTSSTDVTSMTLTITRGGQVVVGPGPSGVNGSYQTKWDVAGTYQYNRKINSGNAYAECNATLVVQQMSQTQ